MFHPKSSLGKWPAIFLIVLIVMGLSGCDFTWRKYYNREHRFTVLLPRFWEDATDARTAILVKAPKESPQDKFQENINIIATELPTKVPLETIYEFNKEELMRVMPSAYNMMEDEIYAGMVPGMLLTFDNRVEDVSLRTLIGTWVRDNRVFVITCVAEIKSFPKYLPIFKKTLQSLRIR